MAPVDRYSLVQILKDLARKASTAFSAVLIRHGCTLAERDAFIPFSVEVSADRCTSFCVPFCVLQQSAQCSYTDGVNRHKSAIEEHRLKLAQMLAPKSYKVVQEHEHDNLYRKVHVSPIDLSFEIA
jgi:hypothetical protein